jgi:DNA adenine methylase
MQKCESDSLELWYLYECQNKNNLANFCLNNISDSADPFLKWAGGKSQLLSQIVPNLPRELFDGKIEKYIEPFLGGGAMFFYLAQRFKFQEIYLFDINPELILTYRVVKDFPRELIEQLRKLTDNYLALEDKDKKKFFYIVREDYNQQKALFNFDVLSKESVYRAAMMIFLNKTCFNGIYRLNSKQLFNVPFGASKSPKIFKEENILRASKILKKCNLIAGDFSLCEAVTDSNSFVYFDPPYRPLSKTSNFTSYTHDVFGDSEQETLAKFFKKLDKQNGAKLMLSNSDPQHVSSHDDYFLKLYSSYNIRKVLAARMINSNGGNRGKISELLITNY